MKIVRFSVNDSVSYGILEDTRIKAIAGEPFSGIELTGKEYDSSAVDLLYPCTPSKIVAIGLNYRSHAEETNNPIPVNPIIFIKPPTCLIGPGEAIVHPADSTRVDYECELAVIIGKRARMVAVEKAADYIFGYSCFNDVTARDHQRDDVQWTRGKSHDTFGPFGPHIETDINPSNLDIATLVNGEIKQQGNTSDMIFDVPEIIRFVTAVMTLLPGDVVITGTPAGIDRIVPGDSVEIRVENIGSLVNTVVKA